MRVGSPIGSYGISSTGSVGTEGIAMICEVCRKDKVILVTRMKLSDEEEPRDVYICDECLKKRKKKGR